MKNRSILNNTQLIQRMKKTLKVAVAEFPPLIMIEGEKYKGFEIDLWEAIAKEIQMPFEYQTCDFKNLISLLAEKEVDVGLAGVTITEKRERIIDFSHETLDSGLLISVNKNRNNPNLFKSIGLILREGSGIITSTAVGAFIFILIAGNLLWYVEQGMDTFNKNYFPGVFESFWLTIITMSSVGYGDYFPHTWLGRVVTVGIIVGGSIIFGLLIARVTAFLTVKKVKGEINNSRDLNGKIVATIEGATSEQVLKQANAKIHRVLQANEAYKKLKNQSVDAVVIDAPTAIYFEKNDQEKKIETVGELFDKQKYGIALWKGSLLRKPINVALLKIIESGQYDLLYKKWFGDDLTLEV